MVISSETKMGICFECGEPLMNPNSMGYHPDCADIAHKRENDIADKRFPFVVIDGEGSESDRFETEYEAEEYLLRLKNSYIEKKLTH